MSKLNVVRNAKNIFGLFVKWRLVSRCACLIHLHQRHQQQQLTFTRTAGCNVAIRNAVLFLNGSFRASLSLFLPFQYSWLYLNRGPLALEATALPTEPKLLPNAEVFLHLYFAAKFSIQLDT